MGSPDEQNSFFDNISPTTSIREETSASSAIIDDEDEQTTQYYTKRPFYSRKPTFDSDFVFTTNNNQILNNNNSNNDIISSPLPTLQQHHHHHSSSSISDRLTRLKLQDSLNTDIAFLNSSEPPSALSLNHSDISPTRLVKPPSSISIPDIPLNDYSTDQTLSPKVFDEQQTSVNINPHQSLAALFNEHDVMSNESSRHETSSDHSSLSSETRENVALGRTSYLNNINYIRDHLDFLNQTLNQSRSPRNSESKYIDFSNILPDTVPGYNLIKQFGYLSYQTNLTYHAIKVNDLTNVSNENFSSKLANSKSSFIKVNTNVIIRLSPNILRNLSLSRLLNEWYILSGINAPKTHLLWSNETLTNDYITDTNRPKLDLSDKSLPPTLPLDLPGVLYPKEALSFTFVDESTTMEFSDKTKSKNQKRMALIYEDFNFKTFKEINCDNSELDIERNGSYSSTGSNNGNNRRRSAASGGSASNLTPSSSIEHSTGFFNGIGQIGATSSTNSLFNKIAKQVTSSPKTPLKVIEIISDMIKVVETLAIVHEIGFVHNGITSSNLLKSENNQNNIKITGWEFSFHYAENSVYGYRKNHLSEISDLIPYMAPEVSGVINKYVDYRSDIYSIGIVLYELLLNTLPFQSEDPSSIIRMHVFQKPVAPHLLAPNWISEKLSSTIMRCLEKNPDDRYLDSYSLLSDLILTKNHYIDKVGALGEQVWNHWKKTGDFDIYLNKEKFKYSEKVGHSPIINFNNKFIGREDVYKSIFDRYNNTFDGGINFFLLSGESGVGKTIILNDLRAGAVFKYDLYCFWKFSCADIGNSIYSLLLDGIKTIITQILECSEDIQDSWRDLIVSNIPLDLSILFYLIPELRKLLGPKYMSIYSHKSNFNTPRTPGKEEQTSSLEVKFRSIIRSFYRVVGLQGLTIFIDDLQWCTEESMILLCELFNFDEEEADLSAMSLKIIATYTTDVDQFQEKISSKEKEKRFKNYVNKSNIILNDFYIPPLKNDTNMSEPIFFFNQVQKKNDETTSMSSMYDKKKSEIKKVGNKLDLEGRKFYDITGGNILLFIYATRMARFWQHCYYVSHPNYGEIVIDNICPEVYGYNRQEVIVKYLDASTTEETMKLLEFAAIISNGSGFHLSDLIVAAALPMEKVFQLIHTLMEAKVIIPTSTYYKIPFQSLCSNESPFDLSDNNIWELASHCSYRFFHDSISGHILNELTRTNKFKEYSRLCALRYYKTISKEKTLNIGGYLQMAAYFSESYEVARPEEKELYIEVLVQAGRYASSTYNMKLAQKLFEVVGELIDVLDSKTQLKSVLTIAQNHYYFKEYEKCLEVITNAQIKYGFDRLVFIYQLVRCKIQLGEIEEAINICFESLPKLGIIITNDEETNHKEYKKLIAKIPVSVPEIRNILNYKRTNDSKTLLIFHLITQLLSPLVVLKKDSSRRLLIVQAMQLIHTRGSSPFAALILLDFAADFAREFTSAGQLRAKELCNVAITLVSKANDVSLSFTRAIYEIYVCTLANYFESMNQVYKYFEISSETDQNDTLSSFSALHLTLETAKLFLLLVSGRAYEVSYMFKRRKSQRPKSDVSKDQLYLFDCEDLLFGSISLNEFQKRNDLSNHLPLSQFCYYCVILNAMTYDKKYDEAVDLILNKVHKLVGDFPLLFFSAHYYFMVAIHIAFSSKMSPEIESRKTEIFNDILHKANIWAANNESTFANRLIFLNALKAMREKKTELLSILDLFEESIDLGTKVKNWYDVCWVCVFCARWLVNSNQNKKRISQFAIRAIDILKRLDFPEYIKLLENEFGKYLVDDPIYSWAGLNNTSTNNNQKNDNNTPKQQSIYSKPNQLGLPISTNNHLDDQMKSEMKINKQARKKKNKKIDLKSNTNAPFDLNNTIQACLGISEAPDVKAILLQLISCAIELAHVDYGVVVYVDKEEPKIQAVGSAQHIYCLQEEPLSSRIDVCPYSLLIHVLDTGEPINKEDDHIAFANRFGKDSYYKYNSVSTVICLPLKNQFEVFGALYLEVDNRRDKKLAIFDGRKRDLLNLFCSQASVAMGKAKLINQMEIAKMAAEDATAEKASFLANMSHEIRTPFNSLLSCSIFLLDTPLNSTQREYVEAIKSSAMVTLNIIDGILAFSKIEHGSFTLESAPFSLNDCIESAIQLGGEQVVDNELELVFFNNCPQIDTVIGDVTRVRQIIINLVGNAIKFTTQGHVIINCNAIQLTNDRYEILISVEDTGIGIPDLSYNKVFGAFSQVDGSSRREFGGSGLGLAISKKLADLMGGDIKFESEEGVGSTFYFNVSFNVKLFSKPEIELPNKSAIIINKLELTGAALKNMLQFFQLKVNDISDLNQITTNELKSDYFFINLDEYDEFNNKFENKINSNSKIVILAQFGKPLVGKSSKYEALLCPFQRERVVRLLRDKTFEENKPKVITPVLLADEFPLKILLAEDNLLNYKVALKYLEKLGFKADHAKDGVEVLEKCNLKLEKGEKYDVILMDIQMPLKDGITATKELISNYSNSGNEKFIPKIVALTANVAGDDREKCIKCGMIDFISKPILPNELKRVLTHLGEEVKKENHNE
ncbi:CHK1 [Candida pseudojiufengensis]|uniref:CHK1 n=1 Tax=Candida pseudojiufengensis TaxID=497109 RepID=UPI00222417F3|nr:CHK1 [Candida pseudojiufengensis]KAI5960152.1 CHK1 [Candida pseudojiufengensis]